MVKVGETRSFDAKSLVHGWVGGEDRRRARDSAKNRKRKEQTNRNV